MTITLFDARCQGRTQRVMGSATLVNQCRDCLRRTSAPADVQQVPWMQPPQIMHSWLGCPGYEPPEAEQEYSA